MALIAAAGLLVISGERTPGPSGPAIAEDGRSHEERVVSSQRARTGCAACTVQAAAAKFSRYQR